MRASVPSGVSVLTALALAATLATACTRSREREATARQRPATAGAASASMVYKDPVTGKLGAPPPGAPPAIGPAPSPLSASTTGLTEVPSPGGGQMVRLEGRFLNLVQATRAAGGTVKAECADAVRQGPR